MKYGQYYIDTMPVGDETDDTYCVIYRGDPNDIPDAPQVGDFTVTQAEQTVPGGLEQVICNYMQEHHPEAETLIGGCTAFFDRNTHTLSISLFGKEILSEKIAEVDEKDYWIGYDSGSHPLDFNMCLDEGTQQYRLAVYPVIDGRTDTSHWQAIALAFDLIGQIKHLLEVIGTDELCLANVEQPSIALWWDNKGNSNETTVVAVGLDGEGDLYLTLYDDCGGDVQIWESCGHLSDNDLEPVLENIRERMAERVCAECGRPVFEGFIVGGGEAYYCSEACLYKHYTPQQWKQMCEGAEGHEEDGNDRNYYTDWWES